MRYLLLIFCGVFFFPTLSSALHIIGGEITYECLGNNRYRFRMNVYRDGSCINCGDLDDPAIIGIYNCDARDCTERELIFRREIRLSNISMLPPPDLPCVRVPPNIQAQDGFYTFEQELPISDKSYHIVYQRCCRNQTITNIATPGDAGATYPVEITPAAQQLCNNSPTFNLFPPTVICAGESLDFDHSASDADGDSLVYAFCAPLLGGSSGEPTDNGGVGCPGPIPDPPCPPSFMPVTFIAPTYSPQNPMGGNPTITIDPDTGLITGTPIMLGQYVVGVCVKEYRNGALIGEIRRDFQFNVSNCEATIAVDLPYDTITIEQEISYFIPGCGETRIPFENQSRDSTFDWEWTFDIDGIEQKFLGWEPVVTFPDTGRYAGQITGVDPQTGCSAIANVNVNIYPAIFAEFDVDYDTCNAGPIAFSNSSYSEAGDLTSIAWNFGNGDTSSAFEMDYLYDFPATYDISLVVRDSNNCEAVQEQELLYYPVPPLLVVAPDVRDGCAPQEVFFDNLSSPISEEYDIKWEFGDGGMATNVSPTYRYDDVGTYDVALDIVSPLGCGIDTVFEELITVRFSPIANFDYSPEEVTIVNPVVEFTDRSQFASQFVWTFNDRDFFQESNFTYTFRDTGLQKVQLAVRHPSGCWDTLIQYIDVLPEVRYFLPSAFTPNDDGTNDVYIGVGKLNGMKDFDMTIWNRWGEVVFLSDNPAVGWNGRKQNQGKAMPNGVYVVAVRYETATGERASLQEVVMLLR
ncbi:MAG: PKD domain-containing protein [Bacteroidota bacterium]